MKFSKDAIRTAFLKEFMTTEVQAGTLSQDAEKSPFGNYREDRYIPSSRFLPCESKKNGVKTVANVLEISGEPDDHEDLGEVVKFGIERYYEKVKSRENVTEKDLVEGFKEYTSGHATNVWTQTVEEATIVETSEGVYEEGTFIKLASEFLAKLFNKPAMRNNYLAFLKSGKLKKGKISALCLLIWLKTTMRIMMWQQGDDEWPDAKFFVKVFYQAMPLDYRNSFKLQNDTKKKVTVNHIADFMTLQEQAKQENRERGQRRRRPRHDDYREDPRPKRSRREEREQGNHRTPVHNDCGSRRGYRQDYDNRRRQGRHQQGGRRETQHREQREDR